MRTLLDEGSRWNHLADDGSVCGGGGRKLGFAGSNTMFNIVKDRQKAEFLYGEEEARSRGLHGPGPYTALDYSLYMCTQGAPLTIKNRAIRKVDSLIID